MKVAICGVWHVHAGGYAKTAKELSEVIGVWEADSERKAKFAENHEISAFEPVGCLVASNAAAVLVCSGTAPYAGLIVRSAEAG